MACAWLCIASETHAQIPVEEQPVIPLARFNPSWAGDRFFGTAAPYAAGHFTLHAGMFMEYAHDPYVIRRVTEEEPEFLGSVVEHQGLFHANATFSAFERLAVNVDLPIAVQAGDDPTEGRTTFVSPSGASVGDLRLGLRANLTGGPEDFFQLGIGGTVWAPTATDGSYLGNGSVRGKPQIMASGVALRFVWGVEAGAEFRKRQEVLGVVQGTLLTLKLANGVLLGPEDQVQLSLELAGVLVPDDISERTTNFEALFGAKWRFVDDWVVGAGVGPGLFTGIGTPDVRAALSIFYTPSPQLRL